MHNVNVPTHIGMDIHASMYHLFFKNIPVYQKSLKKKKKKHPLSSKGMCCL